MSAIHRFTARRRQRGFSLIGLVLFAIVASAVGITLAKAVPTITEYMAITKAVKKASSEAGVNEVRAAFDRSAAIDDIHSISGKDLDVSKVGDKNVVSFAYDREVPLYGPVYLLFKYSGDSSKP